MDERSRRLWAAAESAAMPMPRGRPLAQLTLSDEQRDQLNGIVGSATLPYALVQRARRILASAEGLNNSAVAQRFGVTP